MKFYNWYVTIMIVAAAGQCTELRYSHNNEFPVVTTALLVDFCEYKNITRWKLQVVAAGSFVRHIVPVSILLYILYENTVPVPGTSVD